MLAVRLDAPAGEVAAVGVAQVVPGEDTAGFGAGLEVGGFGLAVEVEESFDQQVGEVGLVAEGFRGRLHKLPLAGLGDALGFGDVGLLAGRAVEPEVGAEHEGGVVGPLGALDLAAAVAVVEEEAVGVLERGVGPRDHALSPSNVVGGVEVPRDRQRRRRAGAVGAGVLALVVFLPVDAPAQGLVPAGEHEAHRLGGAQEVLSLAGELKRFHKGQHHPRVVVVVFIGVTGRG